jgi:translation initiation factor 2B subunit (eIF-2B alpha/beta/delta family)
MASLWNLALQAVAADGIEGFEAYVRGVQRSSDALVRFAGVPLGRDSSGPLRLVTLSASGTVLRLIASLLRTRDVTVACCESRPALEGRVLAQRLSNLGARVRYFTDAALATALDGADAVVVGADAVGSQAFINKIGTLMLATAASLKGVPLYVTATRDKLSMPALWPHLAGREGPPGQVWDDPPPGTTVSNPYFETVPLDLVTGVMSDLGVLGAGMLPDVCAALENDRMLAALDRLLSDDE